MIDSHWCEEHLKMYQDKQIKAVGGKSEVLLDSPFKKKAKYFLIAKDNTLCSSRNMSFYKNVWEEV